MQNRKDSATSMIYLVNGRQLITNVNGISSEDGSGYAIVQGREFKVAPLPDEWRAMGYGEIVAITLRTGEVIDVVLQPAEYLNHVAYFYFDENSDATICLFDKESGAWREMTDKEYEQERRASEEDASE